MPPRPPRLPTPENKHLELRPTSRRENGFPWAFFSPSGLHPLNPFGCAAQIGFADWPILSGFLLCANSFKQTCFNEWVSQKCLMCGKIHSKDLFCIEDGIIQPPKRCFYSYTNPSYITVILRKDVEIFPCKLIFDDISKHDCESLFLPQSKK